MTGQISAAVPAVPAESLPLQCPVSRPLPPVRQGVVSRVLNAK